jgi:hypothetical protein
MSHHRLLPTLALLAALGAVVAHADEENLLGYTEDTEIVPAGQWETYHWLTARTGKAGGSFRALDYSLEFEHGLTARDQLSLYLDAANFRVRDVPDLPDRNYTAFAGLHLAYKHLLRDHERDGYGLAVYLEPEFSTVERYTGARVDEYAVEAKLIFQKESRDESIVYLANLTLEPELAREDRESSHELKADFSHGVSFRVVRHWYAGLENRLVAVYPGWQLHRIETHAVSFGPALHYTGRRWWATVTWLRQLSGYPDMQGGLALEDFEKNEIRLKFGFGF